MNSIVEVIKDMADREGWEAGEIWTEGDIMASETSKCRERLKKWCKGNGLDIGYGGDPIVPTAITLDLDEPYTSVGNHPQNLRGDGRRLYWFKDNCLDYIFSSHLIEDFTSDGVKATLWEWARVIKPGGLIVLYLPDEQAYRAHCKKNSQPRNAFHKIENFSLEYIKIILEEGAPVRKYGHLNIISSNPKCEDYSFEIVLRKDSKNV